MKLKTIDQTIQINATAEKVWKALWDKEHYKKWATAYMPGSHYTGDLKQGNRIKFLDPNNNGMESNVESLTEHREITFHHLHELEIGKEGQSLGNMREKYTLDEQNGTTTLSLSSEMPEEYFNEMDEATKKALLIIKELAEA
ncbi:SRPBCC domain-containing protein [Sphingobacterium phlebotomi]|uniref:SRPBCC domain-containing protein n=1 Tax=Sphingobacterium phlebotomi TaxID=2605433 RepID=A0A5D4H460_9SPHI|nr:SRPBCC domain-containing protein [Sphingobacterium phlebotomi]TYR35304.1 SRPBCC domain-containing protein [Sphingobacterium phlebotomi]